MTKQEAAAVVRAAKVRMGLTWAQLAEAVGEPVAWTVSALLGQQPMYARAGARRSRSVAGAAQPHRRDRTCGPRCRLQPTRGALDSPVPTDPTIYRFYEIVQVYGPTIKELIHEEFGDGIMSAINFRFDVERVPDPAR